MQADPNSPFWYVYWTDKANKQDGRGEACLTMEQAAAWVTEMDKQYPNISHWAIYDSWAAIRAKYNMPEPA